MELALVFFCVFLYNVEEYTHMLGIYIFFGSKYYQERKKHRL